jgi:basic membrane lipoprotein Med (substrate-binding protein (PBP1-ABC) superfamily)
MKKRISLVLAVLAVAASVGVSAATSAPDAAKRLKVGVITVSGVKQGIWDPLHYAAYNPIAKKMNWQLEVAQAIPYGRAGEVLSRWGDAGYDIVFSTDNGFESALLVAAKQYPDTKWVVMSDLSSTKGLKNVASYSIDWCQLGFLQGVAGALVSKTKTIGAVGALPILPALKSIKGIQFGASKAVPGTKVIVKHAGGFLDVQKAQEVAVAEISEGADVLVGITNAVVSPQVAARVQAEGKLYIGSYGDETKYAPKSVVTSVLLKPGSGYQTVAQQVLDGTFKPGIYRKTLKDGFIGYTGFKLGLQKHAATIRKLQNQLASGQIKVPNC